MRPLWPCFHVVLTRPCSMSTFMKTVYKLKPIALWLFEPTTKIKVIKVKQRSARTVKTRKHGWRGLFIFVKTLFPLNFLGILQGQRAITYHGNLISKSCKSRVTSLKNRKSRIRKDGFIEFLNYISISLAMVEMDGGKIG